ncbi:MAG: substrate-binding domain-containing protein [Tessaracoccus sp.]|uniref:substrate-binding domain-containing protein n=1 Tax=Tessaracoccus sp. TaxID=1971211 RepID=UPI001EC9AE6B|nr:substrate-binding domain-containing protein [Tessaracoccus sp.]MBK7819761.1 substrate-binding domain-containing protein [Tessaracoccus sp.]
MKFAKIRTILCGLALATALTACGNTAGTPSGGNTGGTGNAEKPSITIVSKAIAGDFWIVAREGAEKAGADLGYDVAWVGTDTENEGEKQLNQLEAAVNSKPAGIGFAAQNGAEEGAPRILDKAKADGINVVAFAGPIAFSDVPITTVSSNNEKMGQMAAENLSALIGGKGKIAIITNGTVGDAAIRRDSFVDWLKANAPDVEIVDIQNGEADRAKSMDKAQAILQAHPDLAGFYGTSDNGTIAAGDEVASKGLDVKVVGIDASPDLITMLKSGDIDGVVTQNAFDIGYQTVKVLAEAHKGNMPASGFMEVPSVWATGDNLDDPAVKQALGQG